MLKPSQLKYCTLILGRPLFNLHNYYWFTDCLFIKDGGIGKLQYPLLSDLNKEIGKNYGVLLEKEGISLRALFIIDPNGILRQITINDLPIGRSVDETIRLVEALRFVEEHGEGNYLKIHEIRNYANFRFSVSGKLEKR